MMLSKLKRTFGAAIVEGGFHFDSCFFSFCMNKILNVILWLKIVDFMVKFIIFIIRFKKGLVYIVWWGWWWWQLEWAVRNDSNNCMKGLIDTLWKFGQNVVNYNYNNAPGYWVFDLSLFRDQDYRTIWIYEIENVFISFIFLTLWAI